MSKYRIIKNCQGYYPQVSVIKTGSTGYGYTVTEEYWMRISDYRNGNFELCENLKHPKTMEKCRDVIENYKEWLLRKEERALIEIIEEFD